MTFTWRKKVVAWRTWELLSSVFACHQEVSESVGSSHWVAMGWPLHRWASIRLGGSNPHCCQTSAASAGTQAGPSDLPLECFSPDQHLLSMDALVPVEKKSEHSGSRNGKWSGADDYRSTGCGWIVLYKTSYGLWMLWCSWEGLSSTGRKVPPVGWELMMLEKILRGKMSKTCINVQPEIN